MTRDEELLNEIFQKRGYGVICSNYPIRVGERLGDVGMGGCATDSSTVVYVIAETDAADMREQQRLLLALDANRFPDYLPPAGLKYYRVLCD